MTGASSPPPAEPGATRYRRVDRSVHRWVRASVLVGGPGRPVQALEGAAAAVWAVLEAPGTASEVVERIGDRWPALGPGDEWLVGRALALLVEVELVTAVAS